MTVKADAPALISARLAAAWPGTSLAAEPTPLAGGFWASMYRLRLRGQPEGVPDEVVFRIAPDAPMGAKELAVQRTVAEMGSATPRVRLAGPVDDELGGSWSVMDFAAGVPPLGDLNGIAALRRAPALFDQLPCQLAVTMAGIHALDPKPVSQAVEATAPTVAWRVEQLLQHFEAGAEGLGRSDLVTAVRRLAQCRPREGTTAICHGDLHPFNLLVTDDGEVTVIDWTAAIRAEPVYDVAFTSLLLAHPPLDAPGPLGAIITWVGGRIARRFIRHYRTLLPACDLSEFDWYRGLHGARMLVEAASIEATREPGGGAHPFDALVPAATNALVAATGAPLTSRM